MKMTKVCLYCQQEFHALNSRRVTCGQRSCLRENKNKNNARRRKKYQSRFASPTERQEYLDGRVRKHWLKLADESNTEFKKAIGEGTF